MREMLRIRGEPVYFLGCASGSAPALVQTRQISVYQNCPDLEQTSHGSWSLTTAPRGLHQEMQRARGEDEGFAQPGQSSFWLFISEKQLLQQGILVRYWPSTSEGQMMMSAKATRV